jgi:hypothetical protein
MTMVLPAGPSNSGTSSSRSSASNLVDAKSVAGTVGAWNKDEFEAETEHSPSLD